MPTVNANKGSMYALNNLQKTERELTGAIESISSGKRINHAGDDAARAAISSRMRAQLSAMQQSVRNAADVMSLSQVAEGALDESSKVLQRIRELAIQSASDVVNGEERLYIQTEVNQLLKELDRVTRDTKFNEIAVLDGSFADRRFQIGSHEREAATISIGNLRTEKIGVHQVRTDATSGEANLATAAKSGSTDQIADEDFTIHGLLGSSTIDVVANESAKSIAEKVNLQFDNTAVSATASTNLKIQAKHSTTANTDTTVSITLTGKNSTGRTVSAGITLGTAVGNSDISALSDAINAYSAETGIISVLSGDKSAIYLTQDEGLDIQITNTDFAECGDAATHMLVATGIDTRLQDAAGDDILSGSAVTVYDTAYAGGSGTANTDDVIVSGQVTMNSSHTFTVITSNTNAGLFESSPGAATLDKVSEISLRTRSKSLDALKVVDRALDKIHMERAKLGAIMSRMEHVIDNLSNVATNTETARGRMEDANFAEESAKLARAQILQQSAMAMIAQASQTQRNVLTLLQGN